MEPDSPNQESRAAGAVRVRGWRARIVLGALSAAGLAAILLAAWNVNRIATRIALPPNPAQAYWEDPHRAAFEPLDAQLRALSLTEDAAEAARRPESPPLDIEGYYILWSGRTGAADMLGHALIRESGQEQFVFAARLLNGAEARGYAELEPAEQRVHTTDAGIRINGEYRQAWGFARPDIGGEAFMCNGAIERGGAGGFLAYPAPPDS